MPDETYRPTEFIFPEAAIWLGCVVAYCLIVLLSASFPSGDGGGASALPPDLIQETPE